MHITLNPKTHIHTLKDKQHQTFQMKCKVAEFPPPPQTQTNRQTLMQTNIATYIFNRIA